MSVIEATGEPPQSLNRQYVLDEDEYTAAISQIIARDFFPSLVHLDATNDYLDAVSAKDPQLVQASVRRLQELSDTPRASPSKRTHFYHTPSRTPWATGPSDTPLRTPRGTSAGWDTEPPNKKPKLNTSLNLDAFQARYTSEDNSSFTQILDAENQQRKERYGWAWDAQKRVEGYRAKMVEGRERMLIEAPSQTGVKEKFRIGLPTVTGLLTEGKVDGEGKEDMSIETEKIKGERQVDADEEDKVAESPNTALVVRDQDVEVDVMAPRKDTRSAGVDGWKFKARNSLMFSPDADESPYHQVSVPKEVEKHPKIIQYNNTRLPEQDQSSSVSRSTSSPPSPTRSKINAAIEGVPYHPSSPRFSLVPTLPSPTPAELGPQAMKHLMTWGTLTATPRVIQSDNYEDVSTSESPFRISEMSRRETIGHQLSNKASKSLRVKAELLGLQTPGILRRETEAPSGSTKRRKEMPPPTWTPRASAPGNLTPAGRRLLERGALGTAAAKRAEVMDRNAAWENTAKGKERESNQLGWTPKSNAAPRG